MKYYHVSYLAVSLLFLSPIFGFIISTLFTDFLHSNLGRRGAAMLASTSQIVAYTLACLHPPFYALVLAYIFVGLGSGVKNASWNSFISGLGNANELLGLLHGFYGLGATLLPLLASFLFNNGSQWFMVYYFMDGLVATDLVLSTYVFRKHDGAAYRASSTPQSQPTMELTAACGTALETQTKHSKSMKHNGRSLTTKCFKEKVVLLCSIYLLFYVGSEVALGGWLTTFMTNVRHGSTLASGIVTSGFWAGITIGRICLGFVTGRIFKSEGIAALYYIAAAIALELMFWLIPNFVSSAICAAFLGMSLLDYFYCRQRARELNTPLPRFLPRPFISVCHCLHLETLAILYADGRHRNLRCYWCFRRMSRSVHGRCSCK